jgi:hypothetical protein
MSPEEKAKADEIYKAIIGKERNTLVKRYGKDAEKVAKGRAIKQAQKLAEKKMESSKDKLREMVKSALMQEKAGFTDQFDNDPALKGSQKKLPDGLQKAIISKAKGKVGEDLDLGHTDNEPHMLKSDLYHIGKYAMDLYQMVDQFEGIGEVDFPHWWQSKIIKAKEMMSSAKHYLDFETREPEIDAMVGAVDAMSMNEAEQVMIDGKEVDVYSITAGNIDPSDYPDFVDAYADSAEFMDGTPLNDEQLAQLDDKYSDLVQMAAHDSLYETNLSKVKEGLPKSLAERIAKRVKEDVVKGSNIRKDSKGKWRVLSGKTGKMWPQTYDSKADAEDALQAYHATKG